MLNIVSACAHAHPVSPLPDFGKVFEYLLERRPRKLAAGALANKMARIVWAMMTSGESYRQPVPFAA